MAETADIEIWLRGSSPGAVLADLTLLDVNGTTNAILASDVPLPLDPSALLPQLLDPIDYGRLLTAQLFADERMRSAWARARSYMQGADSSVRLRLRLDAALDTLHSLRWETVQEPTTGAPLCHSQRVLLSRYLDSSDLTRVAQPLQPQLRAVVAVANPVDLERYTRAPVDVAGEVVRARAALSGIVT